jgi:hypothetical protein
MVAVFEQKRSKHAIALNAFTREANLFADLRLEIAFYGFNGHGSNSGNSDV